MLRRFILAAVCVLVCVLHAGSTLAQASPPAASGEAVEAPLAPKAEAEQVASQPTQLSLPALTRDAIRRITTTIDQLASDVEQAGMRDDELVRLRSQLETLANEAQTLSTAIQPRLKEIRGQIEKLGPAPAKDAPPEAPAVAEERARLVALAAEADGAVRTMDLVQLRSRQIIGRIQGLREKNFRRDLFRKTTSPLRPAVWIEVGRETATVVGDLEDMAVNWWDRVSSRFGQVLAVVLGALGAALLLRFVLGRVIDERLQPERHELPSFFHRAGVALLVAPAIIAPVAVGTGGAYLALDELGLLGLQVGLLAEGAMISILIYAAVTGLATATCAPERACWRLFDISDATAQRLARLTRATAAVYAIDLFLRHVISTLSLSIQMSVAVTLLTSIAFASLLFGIVRTPFEPRGGTDTPVPWSRPRWLKFPLAIIAVVVLATSLAGFVALGRFLAGQVLLTGSACVLLFLMHLAIRAAAASPIQARLGTSLDQQLGLGEERRAQFSTVLTVILHLVLLVLGLPLILLTWGFSLPDIADVLKALIFGFEIGQFRISLARILLALGLFGAILLGTKLLQRWLGGRVLPAAKVDAGVTNSVLTALGYAGFALAALVAISYAGLDFTNLAIVAGALSVGIGLGLQSVVNNFVSGLIILIERPIKVGDWIVLRDREGIVRRISVRSTEIETFDRASLIIPNSELVAASLLNWTHRNSVGRVTIRVGVSYEADPDHVMAVLKQVAEAHSDVLQFPAPIVAFENFGASSLDFSVRVFLADVMQSLKVQTDLRVAILKEFRRLGIEMPFQQTDVHLRDLDGVKSMLLNALRARQQAAMADPTPKTD